MDVLYFTEISRIGYGCINNNFKSYSFIETTKEIKEPT